MDGGVRSPATGRRGWSAEGLPCKVICSCRFGEQRFATMPPLQTRTDGVASIHVAVTFPVSQTGSEISSEMCDLGALGPFGLQQPEHRKLFVWRETKKPAGAPWRAAFCSASRCQCRLGSPRGRGPPPFPPSPQPLGLILDLKTGDQARVLDWEQAGALKSPPHEVAASEPTSEWIHQSPALKGEDQAQRPAEVHSKSPKEELSPSCGQGLVFGTLN